MQMNVWKPAPPRLGMDLDPLGSLLKESPPRVIFTFPLRSLLCSLGVVVSLSLFTPFSSQLHFFPFKPHCMMPKVLFLWLLFAVWLLED